jgi:hypothetical protein
VAVEIFLFSTATFKYTYPGADPGGRGAARARPLPKIGNNMKGKRVDVYLEVRKRMGHIFFE